MLFKVVGQNQWVIWNCFGSTKNVILVALWWACHIWKLFFSSQNLLQITFLNTNCNNYWPLQFQRECKSFQLLPDELSSVDQLEWWRHHEAQFPLLSKIVKVVFPIPAASSKSEQVFSVAGNVVTPKRARLNPEKVEDLVVVKCNLRLLKGMGFMRK